MAHNYGIEFLWHYLDNFLTLGPSASPVCQNILTTCIQLYERLGLPLHPDKLGGGGAATSLTILGIKLDSVKLGFFCMSTWTPLPDFQVPSDTTGTLGYEAISNSQRFCDVWSAKQFPLSIVYKELIPIIVAAALCDPQWVSRQVKLLCDKSVVTVLMSGTSLDQQLIAACHSFAFTASLIHG